MTAAEITARVSQVRELMRSEELDGILVRSTDRFLNEYVPTHESTRIWLTGFTGSAGEAILTHDAAWVAVDGRYHLQADGELDGTPFAPEKVPLGRSLAAAVADLAKASVKTGVKRLGYEPERYSQRALESLRSTLKGSEIELVPTSPSLIERARGSVDEALRPIRPVSAEAVGRSVAEKVALAKPALDTHTVQAFVVQPLDALAYLTNLRGDDLPYQATFRAIGLLLPSEVVLAVDADRIAESAREERAGALRIIAPAAFSGEIKHGWRVGYDPAKTTAFVVSQIREAGATPVAMPSPIAPMKAAKTAEELAAMRAAFGKADSVVTQAMAFVRGRLDANERVTEAELAQEVERLFLASGATGLSFKVIAAAGENGASIHYSTPDPERAIRPDELVLLDTGAYYAEGYATDLTRTFLAGSPERVPEASAEQKRIFTLVLKAAIAGMTARIPVGARGDQLDAIVRSPLWAEGLDFKHGTGHGVGVNVHEAPPRVSTKGAIPVEVDQVFSIEPGLYLPGFGGVRIENLCTMAPAADAPGFLDVVLLTFAPYDGRLIDDSLLTARERTWLEGQQTT
jgi:Xaa-Pro aminopeptidase